MGGVVRRERLAAIGEASARIVHQSRHLVAVMGWSIHRLLGRSDTTPDARRELEEMREKAKADAKAARERKAEEKKAHAKAVEEAAEARKSQPGAAKAKVGRNVVDGEILADGLFKYKKGDEEVETSNYTPVIDPDSVPVPTVDAN